METFSNYFPHFSNVRHDRRIKRMEKELGLEGYAIYFKLLEILREQIDFRYPMDDLDLLSDEIGTSEQKARVVICNYQLFEVDEANNFFSASFIESMQPYLKARNQRIEAGKQSAAKRSLNGRSTVAEQSKVKESKGNESKLNESKVNETKEIRAVEPEVLRFDDDVSNEHWNKWVKYRKELKKTLTPSSTKSQVEFLNGFAPHTRAEIINQSIQNGWQGLFELKTKPKKNDVNSEIQRIYSGLE